MSYTKEHMKEYVRQWRLKNPAACAKQLEVKRAKYRRFKDLIKEEKIARGGKCTLCGYDKLPALQFHHVRGVKLFNIADTVNKSKPFSIIQAELEKCDLVCANCHFLIHHRP